MFEKIFYRHPGALRYMLDFFKYKWYLPFPTNSKLSQGPIYINDLPRIGHWHIKVEIIWTFRTGITTLLYKLANAEHIFLTFASGTTVSWTAFALNTYIYAVLFYFILFYWNDLLKHLHILRAPFLSFLIFLFSQHSSSLMFSLTFNFFLVV